MKSSITIAVPDNSLYDVFVENFKEEVGEHHFRLVRTTDDVCADMLLSNRAEIAFVSPLGYGNAVTKVDYRIIPTFLLSADGFTGLGSVYFNPSLKSIDKIATKNSKSYVTLLGEMVLSEKFDLSPAITENRTASTDEMLAESDAVIAWTDEDHRLSSLDLSDEWKDSFGFPMCLGFWACRPDELPEDIAEILISFAGNTSEQYVTDAEHIHHDDENFDIEMEGARVGVIRYRWNDESESLIGTTLELLYYHQKVSAISAVKLWGRD